MKKLKYTSLFVLLLILSSFSPNQAQNWPCWRGPNGDGTSIEANLPTRWDSVTNVAWKVSVPGTGYSSPIVFKDRLFITTAIKETQEKILMCYDTRNGKVLWQRTVVKSPFETKHDNNSHASGTPATDGTKVFVSFLDGKDVVVAAYDFSGKQLWLQKPGTFASPHGYSCSPLLFEDKVIINGSSQENPFVAALGKTDGKIIWKVAHERPSHSFSTPIIRKIAGKTQLIFCGNREIASYNPSDGSKYWYVSGPSEDFCSTPVYNEKTGLILVSSAWPQRVLVAIKPDGSGDVTKTHVVWQQREGAYYVPSPVYKDNLLFTTMTTGKLHCIDAVNGNIIWTENMGPQYSSPVIAGGLIYMPKDDGVITVIKPGNKFESIAKNPIGEKMFASPAVSNGKIYLRSFQHLFCISNNGKI
ncbi:MAG TPA: PQQ-binding-like beta-propeller repeat protein [Bacteroidales bacterium]|nr:PQQ-binding-like beta-propeller repeat protein [Bacteroidales bacterium]